MKGQRLYCDQNHPPAGDAEADRWCEDYHRVQLPRTPEEVRADLEREQRETIRFALGVHLTFQFMAGELR